MKSIMFGTVKCFDCGTGEGWITPEAGGSDVGVNGAAVAHAGLGQLASGQTLGFHIAEGSRTAVDLWATWSNR